MKSTVMFTTLCLAAFAAPAAHAGCLTGAAVGGVAGHFAGHHGLIGAAVGCAVGHHQAVEKRRMMERNTQPSGANNQ